MILLQRVAQIRTLKRAWKEINHRKESSGIDGVTVFEFSQNLDQNIRAIRKGLLSPEGYSFFDLKGYALKKKNGGYRPIKIPAIKDRIVQKAIEITIGSKLKKKHRLDNEASFAYLEGKNVKAAAERILELSKQGHRWVYEADIEKFFDNVDTNKLFSKFIEPVLEDRTIDSLIMNALRSEIGNGDQFQRLGVDNPFDVVSSGGIPQGNVLSPLFANVFLSEFDAVMIASGFKMVRYADDFIVMCKTQDEAHKADVLARSIVEGKLGLKIYGFVPTKPGGKVSVISKLRNLNFLGLTFTATHVEPSYKSYKRFIESLDEILAECSSSTLSIVLLSLKSKIIAWASVYNYTVITPKWRHIIDEKIITTVEKIFSEYGFKASKKFDDNRLMRIGIETLTKALKRF